MPKKKALHPKFVEYEKAIVTNPAYEGMPDVYGANGEIQWEAPSNRGKGRFQYTHDRRLAWWKQKAQMLGISTEEKRWISKTAKKIHPTKKKPCAICGNVMDIRYCYLSSTFITKLEKNLPYLSRDDIQYDECTSIIDFVLDFASVYGDDCLPDLADILKCKAIDEYVPVNQLGSDANKWIEWLQKVYIPSEPKYLGPGAMSNAPDRLDGFHTYNRCCRTKQDSGRSKENLKSYATDRRAFELWVDGNWVTANKAMGIIRKESEIQDKPCYNQIKDRQKHAKPITADHIGPISLGFCHRPVFRLLCQSCNSQKNNRMYLSDVEKLKEFEKDGHKIVSWYAAPIWNILKEKVKTTDDALKLSRVMRDNRFNALNLLSKLYQTNAATSFMLTLLHLEYANKQYTLRKPWTIEDSVIEINFSEKEASSKYSLIHKIRRIRIGFESLQKYSEKKNRNGLSLWNEKYDSILECIVKKLSADSDLSKLNKEVNNALNDSYHVEEKLDKILMNYGLFIDTGLAHNSTCVETYSVLEQVMESFAQELSWKWEDPRYERDFSESTDSF